ncbi:RluA family pseudouridine synthase [Mycoplasmatota bacterium]|nr:RluA family pseudouridine synthase [Mycoplasmatota bacterium]
MDYQRMNQYLVITINHEFNNKTIEELLNHYHLSKKMIHSLRMNHDVILNDKLVMQNFTLRLKRNDKLKIPIFIDESIDFIPQNIPIDIIYEDDFLLVVNKQANIEVHPSSKTGLNTLVNAVAYYYQKNNQKHRVRYIHRLDKDTTGAIIFVKNYFVHNLYDYLLMNKVIKRYYLALIKSYPPQNQDIINQRIGKDRHHKQKRIVSKTGVIAKTHYQVITRYPQYTLIKLELFTGRTHQIRVHMASINCPLLGDKLYGKQSPYINRQALHAHQVTLLHPITLSPFVIEVPLPNDFKKLIKKK